MSRSVDPTSLCIISDGPPIEQIKAVEPGDDVSDHTFYFVRQDDPNKGTRILHVLYYRSVEKFHNGDGVTITVVTTNHHIVTILYTPHGDGAFLANSHLVENRRL